MRTRHVCILFAACAIACSWPSLIVLTYLPPNGDCGAASLPSQLRRGDQTWASRPVEGCPGALRYWAVGHTPIFAALHRYKDHIDPVGDIDRCELVLVMEEMNLPAGPIGRDAQNRIGPRLKDAQTLSEALSQSTTVAFVPTFSGRIVNRDSADVQVKELCGR
jgi:hypothetical protein